MRNLAPERIFAFCGDIFETPNPLRHNDFAVLYLSFDNDLITLPIGRIILYPQWIAGKECSFAAYK